MTSLKNLGINPLTGENRYLRTNWPVCALSAGQSPPSTMHRPTSTRCCGRWGVESNFLPPKPLEIFHTSLELLWRVSGCNSSCFPLPVALLLSVLQRKGCPGMLPVGIRTRRPSSVPRRDTSLGLSYVYPTAPFKADPPCEAQNRPDLCPHRSPLSFLETVGHEHILR